MPTRNSSGARAAGRRCAPRCLALQLRNARRRPRCGTRRLARRRALDHATVADGDPRLDEVAAQRTKPPKVLSLVSAGESAEPHDIGRQDRCKRVRSRATPPSLGPCACRQKRVRADKYRLDCCLPRRRESRGRNVGEAASLVALFHSRAPSLDGMDGFRVEQ